RIPDVAITTDVIAGFPGESEAEFRETLAFCEEMQFAGMHVFPYSQRQGTLAARMPGQVAEAVKKERVRTLIDLGEAMARGYRSRFVGQTVPVLWETAVDSPAGRVWDGLTDSYIRVKATCERDISNRLIDVRLEGIEGDVMTGRILADDVGQV